MNLKPYLIIILLSLPFTQKINSQDWNTFANTSRYDKANLELKLHTKANNRVVFMGNSITEGWIQMRPEFFNNRDYHGVDPEPIFRYTLRVDGTFTDDLTEELGGAAYAYLNTLNGERIVVEMRGKQRFDSGDLVTMTIDASEVLFLDKKTELRIR